MALKIPVVDRSPTYPGRVTLTPVSGQENTFDMARADQPLVEGTPINKALFDQKAYALTEDTIVYVSPAGNNFSGDGSSSAPFATIQKAIDSLPKVLDGHMASISIADGTYEERIEIDGFQGGILELGSVGRNVTVRGVLVASSNMVRLNVNITHSPTLGGTPLTIRFGSNVQFGDEYTIDCASSNVSGIMVETGSTLSSLVDWFGEMLKITINNCKNFAIYATAGSKVALGEIAGSNNDTGLYAADGATITYRTRTMTATTANVTVAGGRIYSSAQTSIPNY